MNVGDLCTIWDPDAGNVDDASGWIIGVIVGKKWEGFPQFQVHWSNTGVDKMWYSECDITFDGTPHNETDCENDI